MILTEEDQKFIQIGDGNRIRVSQLLPTNSKLPTDFDFTETSWNYDTQGPLDLLANANKNINITYTWTGGSATPKTDTISTDNLVDGQIYYFSIAAQFIMDVDEEPVLPPFLESHTKQALYFPKQSSTQLPLIQGYYQYHSSGQLFRV